MLAEVYQERTPWDLALALLDRAGRLRPECLFDDRRLERERTVRPLRVGELLKVDEIQLFLVQFTDSLRGCATKKAARKPPLCRPDESRVQPPHRRAQWSDINRKQP